MFKTSDYDFNLPDSLIAQTPLSKRDNSRLLVLNRESNTIEHRTFDAIIDYLKKGDVLVLNNSRVIPARLFGEKKDTKAHVEVLMLKEVKQDVWECLCKPAKRIKLDSIVTFGNSELEFQCISVEENGLRQFRLIYNGVLLEILERLGTMPLPPYIKEKLNDQERYQTIYSKVSGSAAAPTAGLHFTSELLDLIEKKGVKLAYVTLHVGLGTFRPVSVDDINTHKMHSEYFSIDEHNAKLINDTKQNGGRVISVGTTTTRTLESIVQKYGELKASSGETDIFIYPGFEFKLVDSQITNFHLPKSTLMMLVSALSSREQMLNAYQVAIDNNYRFFSFGDSMLIL